MGVLWKYEFARERSFLLTCLVLVHLDTSGVQHTPGLDVERFYQLGIGVSDHESDEYSPSQSMGGCKRGIKGTASGRQYDTGGIQAMEGM